MRAERVLVTGSSGFVGSHLIEFLIRMGHKDWTFGGGGVEVFGADRWNVRKDNVRHLEGLYRALEFDLTDYKSVLSVVREAKPDRIFHLAAQSFVPTSWGAPTETMTANVIGQVNLLEAVREAEISGSALVQIAGSSEEYGLVEPADLPIKETCQLRPLSPYAVSKVAQDLLGWQYFRSYGMRIVRTRAFNHTGPRRGEQFATSTFAKQIAEIEAGLREPYLKVGNIEAERDFTDVRDVVKAYWLALEKGEAGEVYNICSGTRTRIKDVLAMLLGMSGRKDIQVVEDPARMRPSDLPVLHGDSSKFRARTGWRPEIPLAVTLKDLLDDWRRRLGVIS